MAPASAISSVHNLITTLLQKRSGAVLLLLLVRYKCTRRQVATLEFCLNPSAGKEE